MKYFEYVYLVLVVMCLIFLGIEYNELPGKTITFLLIAMFLFSFMFMFRRRQRQRVDEYLEEQRRKLKEELEAEDE